MSENLLLGFVIFLKLFRFSATSPIRPIKTNPPQKSKMITLYLDFSYCRDSVAAGAVMRFCPENVTIHDIWINHGISSCFLETVTSSIVSLFILIFGIAQLIFYYRFATRIEHLPWNKLYSLQVFSHVILIVIACLDILLRHVLYQRPVLGFEVMFI